MKTHNFHLLPIQSLTIALLSMIVVSCQDKTKQVPVGVVFYESAIVRKGNYGDNW